ncbi:DUF6268 family outer membrane beta-barrel protein [Kiritimatiellaeota bacterium B1221]|nr:DUF6268 family outer membrane beta-barrel protein [Kiritimatiellaeota bacterium B1221]
MTQILIVAFWLTLCHGEKLLASGTASVPEEARVTVRSFVLDEAKVGEGQAAYALTGIGMELDCGSWQWGLSRQWFDWRDAEGFVEDTGGEDPWEQFTRLQLGYSHAKEFSEQWSAKIMGGISSEFEKELDESFALHVGGYGVYRANPNLLFIIGMFYNRHQEISTVFDSVPLLGLAWNTEAASGLSAQLGFPYTRVSWHFDEDTRLVVALNSLEGGVARLANDSPVRPGGYVERISATLGLRLETRIGDGWDFSSGIGHSLHREMKFYDSDGGNEHSEDIEQGMGIEISLSRTF